MITCRMPRLTLWLLLLGGALVFVAGARADERPNIIFLLADDQRADSLSCMGNAIAQTPHLDGLAAKGALFMWAFVTDPTCKPSRVTYLTGQYERVHGVGFSSKHPLTERQWSQTYPALLRAAGYYTGFIGKFGVESYAFKGRAAEKFDYWRAHDGWARFFPKPRGNCAMYRQADADIVTPIMAECAEDFLDSVPAGKPFCLSLSFSAPHGSISTSMDSDDGHTSSRDAMTRPANLHPRLAGHAVYGDRYRNRKIKLPATFAPNWEKYIPLSVHDPRKGRINTYAYTFDPKRIGEHHYRYHQLVHGLDAAVGRILKKLDQIGVADNTVIIYSSDHGLLMGEYGMGGKGLCYDTTARVPFVVYDPRVPKGAAKAPLEQLVLSVDVAPTILALAGVKAPAGVQGRDLSPLVRGRSVKWREDVFLENLYIGRDGPIIEAVRTPRYKYLRYFKPGRGTYRDQDVELADREPAFEQLFDLEEDPGETRNLIADDEARTVRDRLRGRCRAESAAQIAWRDRHRTGD